MGPKKIRALFGNDPYKDDLTALAATQYADRYLSDRGTKMPGRALAADRWVEIAVGVILASLTIFIVSRRAYGFRFWLGMAIAAIGISLWALARIQLGSSFSVSPQARHLVTTGLYSKFRNPIYLFGGIGIVGLLVALGNWTVLVMFLALYSIQISRAKKEAKALEATFGDKYRRYRARTWF